MKGSISDEVFVKRVEHILTFNKKIAGKLYPECFVNHHAVYFSNYKDRAHKKQLDFLIVYDDFDKITNGDCYLCGKKSNKQHKNGIDRIDNTKGYSLDNIKPCCGECNYMKRDYEIEAVFYKLELIYNNTKKLREEFEDEDEDLVEQPLQNIMTIGPMPVSENKTEKTTEPLQNILTIRPIPISENKTEETIEPLRNILTPYPIEKKITNNNRNILANRNKKTVEEIREANRIYKEKQREKLRERYGDEEYKLMHAKQIAENRRKKKEEENRNKP